MDKMSLVGFGLNILAATKLVIVVTVNNTLYVHKHIRHRYRLMTAVQEIIEFHSPKMKYKHIGRSMPNNKAY